MEKGRARLVYLHYNLVPVSAKTAISGESVKPLDFAAKLMKTTEMVPDLRMRLLPLLHLFADLKCPERALDFFQNVNNSL